MKIKILIVILTLLIISIHCKQSSVSVSDSAIPAKRIKIDENRIADVIFTFKSSVKTGFIAYPELNVSQKQDIVVLFGEYKEEGKKSTLLVKTYTHDLRLTGEKQFKFGQGPGDVGNNNRISVTEKNFLVSENSNRRVSVYDHNWNLRSIEKHKQNNINNSFYLYDNGKYFLISIREWLPDYYSKYIFMMGTFPGFKTKTYYVTTPYSIRMKDGGVFKFPIDGPISFSYFFKNKEIFLLRSDRYQLLKFDISGKKLKDIIVDVVKETTDRSRLDEFLKDQSWYKSRNQFTLSDTVNPAAIVIPLNKGFVVVRRKNQYSTYCEGTNEGDYFSYQLEYLGKVNVPCFYQILDLLPIVNVINLGYADGYLYLLKEIDEEFSIEKWEVKE